MLRQLASQIGDGYEVLPEVDVVVDALVPLYWIIDLDRSLTMFDLVGDGNVAVGTGPFPLVLD